MKKTILALVAITAPLLLGASKPIYLDSSKPMDLRVDDALSRMNLSEKIALIHAQSKFCSPGVARLGIPELWTTDGPHGIRPEVLWDEWNQAGWTSDSCVAFPALTCLAASWNPDMSALYGKSISEEALYRGKDVLLGPGVNILRTPLNGRNFEYMGEDPYLASKMVVPYIRNCQDNGVAVCVKHYALNNQEFERHNTNVVIDDRTLYEIYLPAFKAAVEDGGAWSIMGSYNLYQNQHVCHNDRLLNKILKGEWGFDGAVISDWGGTHDTREAITNGLDLEFGTWTDGLSMGATNAYDNYHMARPYLELIEKGEVGTDELDEKCRRVLRLIFRTAMNNEKGYGSLCSDEHYEAARLIGDEGIVLLKNKKNLLPVRLDGTGKPRILVVGENAIKMMTVGGGSSSLKVQHEVLPLDGIRAFCGDRADVDFARGYVGDVNVMQDGLSTGQDLTDSRSQQQLMDEAVAKAAKADYVIFVGGLNKASGQDCEDSDRKSLGLPYGQDELIAALAKANGNLVVVNISGNPVAMPWVDKVPAIVQAWFLGSEAGNSIADILFGAVNPSGKLPMTFPVALSDVGAHAAGPASYPGIRREGSDKYDTEYSEGILVGYRWSDAKKIKPLFAFGHGLSYTTFDYGKLKADKKSIADGESITFTIPVTNSGKTAGAEIVQLYISDPESSVMRPVKELKAFEKVYLKPGETRDVKFTVGKDALSYFDADKHCWVAEPGEFVAHAAAASDDIRSSVRFSLK